MKRVGIIGPGSIANVHLQCWQQLPVEIAGYYDLNREAAQRASDTFGGKVYETLDAMLAEVDLVDICTPGHVHKEGVLAAAAAGVPIICEKPLARHLSDCYEMIDACEKANVPLFVAHVVRFFPQFAKAQAVLDSGQIGKPSVIRTVRAGSFPRFGTDNTYYKDFDKSGGVIMDVSIHDIDFVRWCCGEVERVFARGLRFSGIEECDHALITLRFESGAVGHIEGSWAHPIGRFRTRLEIAGDGGLMEWDSLEDAPIMTAIESDGVDGQTISASDAPPLNPSSPTSPEDYPYYAELAHFLDAIENGTPLRVTPHDALMAVKISLAAIESVRTGQPIDIASFEEVSHE